MVIVLVIFPLGISAPLRVLVGCLEEGVWDCFWILNTITHRNIIKL